MGFPSSSLLDAELLGTGPALGLASVAGGGGDWVAPRHKKVSWTYLLMGGIAAAAVLQIGIFALVGAVLVGVVFAFVGFVLAPFGLLPVPRRNASTGGKVAAGLSVLACFVLPIVAGVLIPWSGLSGESNAAFAVSIVLVLAILGTLSFFFVRYGFFRPAAWTYLGAFVLLLPMWALLDPAVRAARLAAESRASQEDSGGGAGLLPIGRGSSDNSQGDRLATEATTKLEELMNVLSTIRDEASLRAAKPRVVALVTRIREIVRTGRELEKQGRGRISPQREAELKARLSATSQRAFQEGLRISQIPGHQEILAEMTRLSQRDP